MKPQRFKVRELPTGPMPEGPPPARMPTGVIAGGPPPVPMPVTQVAEVIPARPPSVLHAQQALELLGLLRSSPDESSSE